MTTEEARTKRLLEIVDERDQLKKKCAKQVEMLERAEELIAYCSHHMLSHKWWVSNAPTWLAELRKLK